MLVTGLWPWLPVAAASVKLQLLPETALLVRAGQHGIRATGCQTGPGATGEAGANQLNLRPRW